MIKLKKRVAREAMTKLPVVIKHSPSTNRTPAFAIIVEGFNELVQDGFTRDYTSEPPYTSTSEVLYASGYDDEIIGVLVFSKDTLAGIITLNLIYVEPSSRRMGVGVSLLSDLINKCKGFTLSSNICKSNEGMVRLWYRVCGTFGKAVSENYTCYSLNI